MKKNMMGKQNLHEKVGIIAIKCCLRVFAEYTYKLTVLNYLLKSIPTCMILSSQKMKMRLHCFKSVLNIFKFDHSVGSRDVGGTGPGSVWLLGEARQTATDLEPDPSRSEFA
jgi:hypothetical protein